MNANIPNRPPVASNGRKCAILALFMTLAAFGLHPVRAQTPTTTRPVFVGGEGRFLFEARGVPVDVTAATITEARERALTDGRIRALRQVVEHLSPREDVSRLPSLPANDIIDMVQEFSIANERTSAVRYIAEMNVRFDPEAIRRLLRGAKIPFTEIPSRPMVLVPLDAGSGKALSLEEDNPWRDAWAHLKDRSPLVPLILAAPDAPIRAEQAQGKDVAALDGLAAHYDAAGVIIVKLNPIAGDNIPVVVTLRRGTVPPTDMDVAYTAQAGQTREEALMGAAAVAADAIAQNWIKRNLVDLSVTTQLTALAPLKELKDWLRIRQRLRDVALIERIDLQAITRDRAQVTLRYAGDQTRLQAALAEEDLALSQQGGVWVLGARKPAGDGAQ